MTDPTPGPWEKQPQGRRYKIVTRAVGAGQGEAIAQRIEFAADANLMVAAPELLKAITDFLADGPASVRTSDRIQQMRRAIAKARTP